ncbi:hypothetical protein CHU98_g977 [Xylaria longipes]|nr:hypothetical protein CHU98_g977 [Xylaria longipes]
MGKLMIYGATGYTGRIACQHAKSLDLQFVLGGRSQGKLAELAAQLTAPCMVFSVDNPDDIALALKDIKVLLNCAGPFAGKLDEKARRSGVMLLPGCGGSVSMLGCLVLHALRSEEQAVSIDVALYVTGPMSRGSAISAAASLSPDCLQRRDGTLVQQDVNSTKQFDFDDGHGPVACFPVTLPDLITIWKSTGVSNIRTFVRTSAGSFPTTDLAALPDGPTAEQRKANPYHASVIITKQDNDTRHAVLHTVNGYTFTGIASVEAAKRVFAGEVKGGFQTPAEVFGKGFVESVTGSRIVDI